MWNRIPKELQIIPQWVAAGSNKIPLNPMNGLTASPVDPATWGTFESACRANMQSIGFVLTNNDPYCIIDLDVTDKTTEEHIRRYEKIMAAFPSYTERSRSGKGVHIVIKARLPSGSRRDGVEIYSAERYMIFTGDVIVDLPIAEMQETAMALWAEMQVGRTSSVELKETEEVLSDDVIMERAANAANGDKFRRLWTGDFSEYPSQSEADFALLAIIAFYTKSNEQVRRLFRTSALGKREKAVKNNDYLDRALSKIRAKAQEIDISGLTPPVHTLPTVAKQAELSPPPQFPPGLLGDIATHILSSSIRPVPEIALATAIAFMAGVCGRSYNISGAGLNQYIIVLAETGVGKDGTSRGIDNIIAAVQSTVPACDMFLGPSAFASGQALVRVLNEKPCFVSVLGEFGLTLQQMCDVRANPAVIMLKKVLLDIYAKSGNNGVLRPSVYADSDKNTKAVESPNVTILGESTPDTFFGGLDSSHIAEGLIPRFTVIQYTGKRPARNRNAGHPPNPVLLSRITDLFAIAVATNANRSCAHVQMTAKAASLLDAFDEACDERINSTGADIVRQLWNRAHLKALKLSALIAVGLDPHAPVINEEAAAWALRFVESDIAGMLSKFSKGEVGTGETRHEADIRRAVDDYLRMPVEKRLEYSVSKAMADKQVIPFHFLRRRLRLLAAFKNDPRGAARAIQESLGDMVRAEILGKVPDAQAQAWFGSKSDVYVTGATW